MTPDDFSIALIVLLLLMSIATLAVVLYLRGKFDE